MKHCLFLIVLFIGISYGCKRRERPASQVDSTQIRYEQIGDNTITIIGSPDTTTTEKKTISTFPYLPKFIKQKSSQLIVRLAYTTSYNKETRCANWVAWHLTHDHTDGPYLRKGVPYKDEEGKVIGVGEVADSLRHYSYMMDMETEEPRQRQADWKDKTYEMSRGHLCPAGDNKWDKGAMNQTFLLTNICPQTEELNGGSWKRLEESCRSWAEKYGDIYIVTGPIFYKSPWRTMGEGKLAVPDAFFKVVLCMNGEPKAIGFIFNNDEEPHNRKEAVRTVDEVEKITGFDFFPDLPDEIENNVESKSELTIW